MISFSEDNSKKNPEKLEQSNRTEITIFELGPALRYHRHKAGLTQAQLARLAGVGKTVIFDIEKGKPSVQLDTLQKILQAVNVKLTFWGPLMEKFLQEYHAKR